jgi:hypothetical protein
MKRSKFSEEQIAHALRQVEAGTPVGNVCRPLGVTLRHLDTSDLRSLVSEGPDGSHRGARGARARGCG